MYATYTGTAENLHAMHTHGVRLVMGPDQLDRATPPPLDWCLDNGAYGAFVCQAPWRPDLFEAAVEKFGAGADFIVAPDVVQDAGETLRQSVRWLPYLRRQAPLVPVYLAVQDGMSEEVFSERDVDGLYLDESRFDGIFVGGSTVWKEQTMHAWGRLADRCGVPLHVGRVNTVRRIQLAIDAGAQSADGTSITRYAVNAPRLTRAAGAARNPILLNGPARPLSGPCGEPQRRRQ